jgi:hypothetical protein
VKITGFGERAGASQIRERRKPAMLAGPCVKTGETARSWHAVFHARRHEESDIQALRAVKPRRRGALPDHSPIGRDRRGRPHVALGE